MSLLARILRAVGFLQYAADLDARDAAKLRSIRRKGMTAGELAEDAEREARNLRGWRTGSAMCATRTSAESIAAMHRAVGRDTEVHQDAVGWWVVTWSGPP